ncbi:MAG: permease [Pseudomonadota bacterium]
MSDTASPAPRRAFAQLDRIWLLICAILLAVALVTPRDFAGVLGDTGASLAHTGIFIVIAVGAIAYLRATGAETLLAQVFTGRAHRMIVLGAVVGGLAPFCSCEVIPFVAAMLALGAPLSAAMAFWLASPLMDPAMFMITAGTLGLPFAVAKTVAAVGLGLFGGFAVQALARTTLFADPLRARPASGGCCAAAAATPGLGARPVWRFWQDGQRRATFAATARDNGLFLLKWMTLAYVLEALMMRHIPAEWIAGALGGDGPGTVLLAALVGGPAYLNGYAAAPLLAGLVEQGMSQGAAMAFVIAGGVSCIPAAVAVWALVKPRVFLGYLSLAFIGALAAGLTWGAIA